MTVDDMTLEDRAALFKKHSPNNPCVYGHVNVPSIDFDSLTERYIVGHKCINCGTWFNKHRLLAERIDDHSD